MPRLILLGGPPGVGKSSAIQQLSQSGVTCIEADEISPPSIKEAAELSINRVILKTEELLSRTDKVVVSWVFARSELYRPFLVRFSYVSVRQLYLVCSIPRLKERLSTRNTVGLIEYSIEKLQLINHLPFEKIDTTEMTIQDVTDAITHKLTADA